MELIRLDQDTARVMTMLKQNLKDKSLPLAAAMNQRGLYSHFMEQVMETREAA